MSVQCGAEIDVDSIEVPAEPHADESLIRYAVEVSADGIGLTIFEGGRACTVDLSNEAARKLADLLTRRDQ